MNSLFDAAGRCLNVREAGEKLLLTRQTAQAWHEGRLSLQSDGEPKPIGEPGRPSKPVLVLPGKVPKRRLGTPDGLAALIHAIAHIEFNAINLAWDAIYRFRGLPEQFYGDWPAHNGLWEMAVRTAGDPLMRMALVPRMLEARGLDVTPVIIRRLQQIGDEKTVTILEIILRDEIEHVAIGSRWFNHFCHQRRLDAEHTFRELVIRHFSGQITGPFHYEARQQAGFTAAELQALEHVQRRRNPSAASSG